MAEDNLQYDTEQPEIQVDDHPEQEQQGPGDPPSKVLWEKMVKNKRYSFSYDDFQKEYNSKEAVAQLHKDLRGVGAKVVPINDFYAKYFPDLAGAKSSTTKPAQNEKPTAAGAQQQPVTSQTPKLAPQVFEKPITSQQYAPMDGIPAYGSPEYKKIKAAEAEKQSKQVAQQRAFQEFETAYDKFNIAKKNVDNGNDPDEQGVLSNGKPYSKAIGGKGVIENVSDFIIGHIVPSEAVKQEQERSRMQSKLLSYSSANEKALKTAQVYIDDITNEALKGYTRLSKISSVDGVHTPDPIKIRQYINNRAESSGFSKDGPVYDILNSKITAGVEYAIKKPTIEKNANEISKKETGKSIQELVSAEQQAIIQSATDINTKAKLQAETLAQKTISANKTEAQDLFNTKYKPLYDERNAISEQAASAFEKQFAHLIKDGKFIGSPQEYEMYNQQLAALQAIDDENKALADSWSKELFKEQGRIASKYNKQYMAGISALEASTKKELAKKNEELKAFKVSPGLLTKINRYYEEAYKKTVTDEDAAKAPKGFLQTLSAFDSMFTHNFLDAMANYAGRMGLKGIESVFASGANEFNPQQIEMNKFSDFLSPYKVIGSAATMGGRMGPAIAAGAITGAVTKNTGMAFRAFMAGANEWLTENTDNAHSTYKDVLAETGDPAKAENAAQKQYEAGMINLPLYGLGWMPFFSKSFNKLPLAAKIVAGTAIETGTELPTEFSQTLQEESIKETGDWKNMLDYATWEKAKNTFYNIVPLSLTMGGGGHVVTHFADKVTYNQKVDALVQATEIGGASASQQDQYAFNLVKIGDTKLAKAVLVGLHQSGRITDKELNRLNATVDKAKSITESAEKLGMNEGEQRIYAALNYQFEEAKANMATEKDPIAREAWKLKAANAQQNITNFAATKQGDYAIVTYADGGQSVFSHEEINNALSTPVVAKSLKKGTLKIEVFGKEKEALAEKIKQTTEAEKKSTTGTSVTDDETENGNDDFSVEKVEAADGITHYLPTSSTSGYFKDEQGEDISFTTEQEAKDFLSKQPKAQVPTLSTQSKKETLTKEQDEAKQRVATFIDNTVSLPTTDATLREKLENDPKAALQELIDFHEQQKSGKDEKTQVFHQKAIDKFEALKNDIDLINQQPQKSAETQKHDGSKSKDVESAIDGGKSQQPGQLQQNEVEIPNTPEASQLDEERKKAIAPLQAVAGGKATHTIQLPQRGKNTATILQNGREAGSIILTPEEQSLNDQKEAGREAGLVTDEEYNEWHKGFTAKVAARAIDATNKQYAKKQEALVNNPPSFLQRVKNLDLEAITDPIGRVLKYFALGGKINTNFVKEQYGGKDERIRQSTSTEEQRRSMFSLLAKDAPNIEKLAEQLEAEANQHNDGNSRFDTRDYVSAIEEVLSSHQSPASAAKELWEKYSPEATEAEIAKLWEQKGGSQTQEESAPLEETEVQQPLTINGEEISFSADNSNPQTASQEPKLLTPNDPKFKRLQKAINRFLSKIKGYSTEVLHGQDFQKLVDWAKRQQDITDNVKQIFETEESDKEPKYFRRPNGTIYGIKVGTKIYLNGDKLNLETPAHEAGHIFRDWAKENAPDLYKAATKLMSRPNKYREMVLANETYKEQIRQMKANGATAEQINEFIADEALAHMIGDRAAKIVENRSQFVQWLKDLWESIKLSMPGAKDFENKTLSDFYKMTWEQFGNAATERILSGRALAQADSRETGDIRFMASGISNSNTIFEEDEKTQYYKTSEGEKIPYRVYDTGSKKDGNNASTNLLQRQENTEQGNDFALVERQFTEYKQLDFTAGTKIESLNDVAWLFHNLEDESVEHSFAVYIMPNGSYVVQHLSTGGIASTVIDGRLVSGNAVKMGAKSVAFVHNHPSGALRASDADMHVYSKLKKSLEGTGIDLQDGVIINLKSGKYVTFDAQSNAVNDITKQNQAQHKVQVLSFSKQVFAENYNPDKITGYSDVAMLLSTKKFGVSDKTEMLVLNNALEVVGKFVLPENNQYAKIIELLTQYGGVNAILYGNKINAEEVNDYNRRLVSIGFKISDAIEVKSDNYKSLVSEGLINEDQPLYESNSPSNTDNHEAAKKKTQGNRIEKSPLTGGKRKEIRHIIRDFKNAAKTRIFYTKVGRRAAGTYNSSEGAIRLRYAGDLDTTAHEAGHDIDDRYKVIEAILKNPAARAELVPFVASPAASKPPKGHPNPQNYLQREGFAEWLRAFIVNPDEAKAQAPEIYKIYEAQVHDNMKKAVHHFSNDVRTFAGLEGIDQLLSNVELTPETKSFFDRFKDKNHEGVFHISWVDKIKINMLNSLQAFDKAWNIAKGLKGIDEVLPENDPTILVRLLYGFDGKFGSILETGMINSKNEVLEDANGNAKNLDWLLEPLDRYNEKTIKKEQEYTIAFMLAERTVELSKRFKRDDVLSGIGGGVFKDIEVAQAALDEINALPPVQKARIEEAARRYREFANDILQYMVDKGRLSKEQYDAIKKENVQYVAMQRIIDQEPGTELEVFTMNGNSIGSVAKPVHNIQGSSRTIINPYSSLLDGLYRSIKEADRNEILVAFTDMVSHIRSMGDGEVIPFSDIAIKGKPGDKNTQVVYHNGKPEYWIFQQDIHEAIKGLNEEAEGLLMKYGKIPGTILRETITKFPVFAARNFIRDTQDRIIKSSDSNLLDLVGNSAHWKDIARFGGLNSGFYMRDRASYYGLMKESMKRLAKNKNTIVLSGEGMKRVWDRYEKALQTSETINRVAEYRGAFREAKKKGMDDYNAGLYAASRARNLIDFAEAGVIMRQLNKLIPFSNAAVQGMRSAVNRAIEDPGGFAIRTGVYSVLPAVMLWMWNHRKDDDDDKENEYENLPAYQRDMYHNLKIGKNKWLSILKPYELSLVSSGIDRGMSLFFGKNKNAFQGYGGTVIQSVMPLDESSMFGPFRPIYEGISNYDVFRQKNIVPIYENDLDLSLRHTETASLLGQWLQSASNIDARKIDHFIQGQFGYFGKAAMKLSNINREDGGRSFDITDLGFFKESPGYNSPDVQNLLNYAKRWGLTQNIDFKDIKALNQAIFDAKTDEEKEAAKKELITHSRLLLLQWKAEGKAKQKQDKFKQKPR